MTSSSNTPLAADEVRLNFTTTAATTTAHPEHHPERPERAAVYRRASSLDQARAFGPLMARVLLCEALDRREIQHSVHRETIVRLSTLPQPPAHPSSIVLIECRDGTYRFHAWLAREWVEIAPVPWDCVNAAVDRAACAIALARSSTAPEPRG